MATPYKIFRAAELINLYKFITNIGDEKIQLSDTRGTLIVEMAMSGIESELLTKHDISQSALKHHVEPSKHGK